MLKGASLPKSLWVEALVYTTQLINYVPTKANNSISPYELWEGWLPRLAHLCAFSEHAFMHVLKHLCNKLGDTTWLVTPCTIVCGFPGRAPSLKCTASGLSMTCHP
jgi:hypothetical protein